MRNPKTRELARRVAPALVVLASLFWFDLTSARAQGCAMCYNAAAATKAAGIRALDQGILILLLPPLVMFIGIFVRAFRCRERSDSDDASEIDSREELARSA